MKIAFRKNPKGLVSKLVCWWTKSPYYHCELVFSSGYSFSAVPEENKTRFTKNLKLDHDWDVYDLNLNVDQEYELMKFCLKEKGCKYDWTGIFLTQVLPLSVQSKTRWFCSEICMAALQELFWFSKFKPHEHSPGELHNLIVERLKGK